MPQTRLAAAGSGTPEIKSSDMVDFGVPGNFRIPVRQVLAEKAYKPLTSLVIAGFKRRRGTRAK